MVQVQVASVFSNYMVLQRDKIISIFGWLCKEGSSDEDENQTVQICAELLDSNGKLLSKNLRQIEFTQTDAATQQKWIVQLEPQKQNEDCTLNVTWNTGSATFTNIAIGEVWLAGGQSNMELELQNCLEGPRELADINGEQGGKNVRFYYTNKLSEMNDAFYAIEKKSCWQTWNSPFKKAWSAVGYFFAKKLAQDLDCTVGLIGCNWGGTSASTWMRREYLERDEDLATYLTEPCSNPDGKPGMLYRSMVNRVLPYTIKGVLWYQGESDDHKPHAYAKLFSKLIDNWRTDWNEPELPFVFVQLPGYRKESDKDFKHWCLIRAAQEKVSRMVQNTWMTCALDLGQFNEIHPKAKRVLAERLEQNALVNVYDKGQKLHGKTADDVLSPSLKTGLVLKDENSARVELSFENARDGFVAREDKINLEYYRFMEERQNNKLPAVFTGFEIAGADGEFYPASFKLGKEDGRLNLITVSSPLVKNPVSVRYAWFNYGPVTIFGKNGLPLAPFYINL